MDRRQLDYIDTRDPQALADFVNNAPEPAQGEPLPQVPHSVLVVPRPPRLPVARPRTREEPDTPRRSYTRASARQKAQLSALFAQHGDSMSVEWYASRCGITDQNTKKLLWKIRRGESILPKNHYKRKSRVLPFQHLVMRVLNNDPTTPLTQLREDLEQIVALNGGIIANVPDAIVDQVLQRRAPEQRQEAAMDETQPIDDDTAEEGSETVEEGSETIEVPQGQVQQRPTIPSVSAISKFLRGLTGTNDGRQIPVISFKKCHTRGPAANTDANKTLRIEAITQLQEKMADGYLWVCIDETAWSVGNTTAYGWSKRGDPCFVTKARGGVALTSISSIDTQGIGYCILTTTTNTTETFNAYFRRLIQKYDNAKVRCVFWVDNCRIHNEMETIVRGSRHCVVYNAAYSPELNPIENIFGIWKRYAERDIREWTNLQDLLDKIAAAFVRIESNFVIAAIERCRTGVWQKALDREDL